MLEYIWKAAWSLHEAGDPAAEDWVAARALAVLAGDSDGPSQEITAEAGAAGLAGSRRNGADACVRYLRSQARVPALRPGPRERLAHRDRRHRGSMPAPHRRPPRHSGARWGLDGAEAVLTLRAVISNGDFEEYWHFHLAREHQRLYPGTKQGQYALGA